MFFSDFREREEGREGTEELGRVKGRERKGEKYQCETETSISCLLYAPLQDLTSNLGLCPDHGSNLQPFGSWDDAPTD